MKNPFLLASAIAFTTYPAAVAAEFVGLLPSSVINFPTFIGFFTATSVLALAFSDYARKGPSYDAARLKRRQLQRAKRPEPAGSHSTVWVHRTVSS